MPSRTRRLSGDNDNITTRIMTIRTIMRTMTTRMRTMRTIMMRVTTIMTAIE